MRAQGAAPESCFPADSRGGGFNGNATSLAHPDIPPHIVARLAADGVRSLDDWRALGKKRLAIFGIVPSVARQLDKLAKTVQP